MATEISNRTSPKRDWRAISFFTLLLLLHLATPDYIGDNAMARFDTTKAVVIEQRFTIDSFVKNTIDWSHFNNHYYSNKAPGVSLLLVPFYTVAYGIERMIGIDPLEKEVDKMNLRLTDSFVTAIPSVVLSVLLFLFLKRRTPDLRKAYVITLAYSIGTIAFLYASMLWGHQTAAALLFGSFFVLSETKLNMLSGFLFGLSVLTEYTSALAGLPFIYYIFNRKGTGARGDNWKTLWQFTLGGLPILFFFAYYNSVCFGSPFALANRFQNPDISGGQSEKLLGVMQMPSLMALFWITFGPIQGLYFICPVLLFAWVGFVSWWKCAKARAELVVALSVVLLFFLFNISFDGWFGGWCAGPRYLVPMLPFLVLPLLFARTAYVFSVLLAVSIVNILAIAAVDIQPKPVMNLLADRIYLDLLHKPELWPRFTLLLTAALGMTALAVTSPAVTGKPDGATEPVSA